MQGGGGGRSAGQDERIERRKIGVELVDRRLELIDLAHDDAQRRTRRLLTFDRLRFWRAEIGAEIEQIVLDAFQHRVDQGQIAVRRRRCGEARESDRAIGLINLAIGGDTPIELWPTLAISQARRPIVAGARVDLVELDHPFPSTIDCFASAARDDDPLMPPRPENEHDYDDRRKLQADAPAHQELRSVGRTLAQHIDEAEDEDERHRADRDGDAEIGQG